MSIRMQIFDDIETALKTMSTANGYNLDYKKVVRFNQRGTDFGGSYPVVSLLMTGGEYRQNSNAWNTEDLLVEVGVHLNHDDSFVPGDTDAYIDQAVTDVIRAVLVDPERGGNAIDTRVTGWRRFLEDDLVAEAGAIISLSIPYNHAYGDPR